MYEFFLLFQKPKMLNTRYVINANIVISCLSFVCYFVSLLVVLKTHCHILLNARLNKNCNNKWKITSEFAFSFPIFSPPVLFNVVIFVRHFKLKTETKNLFLNTSIYANRIKTIGLLTLFHCNYHHPLWVKNITNELLYF